MPRPVTLPAAFGAHWRRHFALPAATVVVAVSGGRDSMTLLALLARDRAGGDDLRVVAAHFDHRTRGADSAADGRLVAAVARRWGARAVLGRGDAPGRARRTGRGPQAAARDLRYAFLEGVVARTGAAALVTAHHRDDRVETVLLRLARGTSPAGLGALGPIDRRGGTLILRPLLPFTRAALAAWAAVTTVPYREDPSNRAARAPRTRVREDVVPRLQALNPRADEAVVRLATMAAADAAYLDRAAGRLVAAATRARGARVWRLAAGELAGAPDALLSRAVLRGWAWTAPRGATAPGAEWVEGALAFLRGGRGGQLPVPGGGTLARVGSAIEFRRTPSRRRRA